jgi:O-antigen ligase
MGVFDYKNGMGSAMGLSLLIEWQLPAGSRLSKVLKVLAMLLAAVLLRNSDSVTPAVALAGTFILLTLYKFLALRWRVPLYAVLVMIAILVSVGFSFVVTNSDSVMGLLGRSSNLTGRTEIWSLVISFIPQRAILGYGYSGFWSGASRESFVVDRIMRGPVYYSHNGYLEILLTLGLIGFLLTLVLIGTGMKRAINSSRQSHSSTALWPLAFLLYVILHNIGECTLMGQDIEWALCVSCIVGADPRLSALNVEEEEMAFVPMEEPART